MKLFRPALIILLLLSTLSGIVRGQVVVEDNAEIGDTEIPYRFYPADNAKASLVWFEPQYSDGGPLSVASALASEGYEVWQPNLFEAFFLPRSYSSLEQMDGTVIAAFLRYIRTQHGKPIYLIGAGRGTVAALNALAHDSGAADGLVALNPSIYAEKPEPLKPVRFVASASQCAVNIELLQPARSTRIWWVDEVESTLRQGGAQVNTLLIPDVRDGFWQRPDITPEETARRARFHLDIIDAIDRLEQTHAK